MEISNNRLIISEDELEIGDFCEQIRQIIQDKLDELGHGNVIANVDLYENCNKNLTHFWNQIDIDLVTSEGFLGNIEFTTNDIEPSIVVIDGKFDFYYVFVNSSNTCTSLKYMVNTGFAILIEKMMNFWRIYY